MNHRAFNPPKIQLTTIAPGILPGVGLGQMTKLLCKCGNNKFYPAMETYHASSLQTTVGRPMIVKQEVGLVCSLCHKINNFDGSNVVKPVKNVKK